MLFSVFCTYSGYVAVQLSFAEILGEDRTVEVAAEVLCSEGWRKTDLEAQEIRKVGGIVCIMKILHAFS